MAKKVKLILHRDGHTYYLSRTIEISGVSIDFPEGETTAEFSADEGVEFEKLIGIRLPELGSIALTITLGKARAFEYVAVEHEDIELQEDNDG